jgi:hypothetical protein
MLKHVLSAAAGGLFVCASLAPLAADTGDAPKDAPTTAQAPVAGESAVKAYVDPETGTLVKRAPTQAEERGLALPQIDMSQIQEIHNADGSTTWIHENVVDAMVAVRGSDGKLTVKCAEHGVVDGHAKSAQESANDR